MKGSQLAVRGERVGYNAGMVAFATRQIETAKQAVMPRADARAGEEKSATVFTWSDDDAHITISGPSTHGLHGFYDQEPTEVASVDQSNQQYSILALTDSSGNVSERYAYTAYGQPTFLNASATVQTSSAAGYRYTYTAREWDATLGLHHFRARWMSGLTGRFLSKDPIGFAAGDTNLYRMTGNHPNMATDPSGLFEGPVHTNDFKPSQEVNTALFWARSYIRTASRIEAVNAKYDRIENGIAYRNYSTPESRASFTSLREKSLRVLKLDLETYAERLLENSNVAVPDLWKWHDDSVQVSFQGGQGAEKMVELAFWLTENRVELGSSYSMGGGLQNVSLETALIFTGGGAAFLQRTLAGVAAKTAAIEAAKVTGLDAAGPLALLRPVKGGFGVNGQIGSLPTGAESSILKGLYLDQVNSNMFGVKLGIHNTIKKVTTLGQSKWVSRSDIRGALETQTSFRVGASTVHHVGDGFAYVFTGGKLIF